MQPARAPTDVTSVNDATLRQFIGYHLKRASNAVLGDLADVLKPFELRMITYTALVLIVAAAGAGVAGRHVWLQNLPADQVPACGPGFDYIIDSFPLSEALALIFTGSGECATIDWQFLGLSMPAWVLIAVVPLGVFGIWNNLRAD